MFLSTTYPPYPMRVTLSPRTPVFVGRSQIVGADPALGARNQPIDLMTEAVLAALNDAGIAGSELELIGVVNGLFSHPNPGRDIARAVGAPDSHTVLTTWGGNTPIAFAANLGQRIAHGELDVAVMVGGEANASRDWSRKMGQAPLDPVDPDGFDRPETWGAPLVMDEPQDRALGADLPRNTYAVLESVLRAAAGESLDQARDTAAMLWAGYSAVAAGNPDLSGVSALPIAEIRNPSPSNRMVSWPYTKALCANNRVDHASAVILTSLGKAQELGLDPAQVVYLHGTVTATDTDVLLNRTSLSTIPGLDAAIAAVTHRWGSIDDFAHLDLYGCFPSIVRYSQQAMKLSPGRNLTVTGGLGFMGAPLNYAAGQSLSAMIRELRNDPGSMGMVQGNGGHTAKHALGVYSTVPPTVEPDVIAVDHPEPEVARAPDSHQGPGVLEGLTVEYSHDGPERFLGLVRTEEGRRLWATSNDSATMAAATTQELVGARVKLEAGVLQLVDVD